MSSRWPTAEEAAARFDRLRPGWYNRVDLDRLYMLSPNKCIAGQVFAQEAQEAYLSGATCYVKTGFGYALDVLGISGTDYGLYLHKDVWVKVILERRGRYNLKNSLWHAAFCPPPFIPVLTEDDRPEVRELVSV